MKFKKGSKLKVLNKRKVALGPQCSMEALRSNGSNSMAGYVMSKGVNNHDMVEKVSRKVIVPCHTRLDLSEAWAPGDVVEVFDNNLWKIATVSEVLGKMHILVRLLGSSQEFKVRKTHIRVRQSLEDDDNAWVMVEKGNKNSNGGKLHTNLFLNLDQNSTSQVQKTNSRTSPWKQDDCFVSRNKKFQDSYDVRVLKRSTDCSSKASYRASHKVRPIEKKGRYVKVVTANRTLLPKLQVDPVSCPRDSLGERHWPASLNHRLGEHLELDIKDNEPVNLVRESNDIDSIMCSVGSCSISSDNSSELPCDMSDQNAGHFCEDRSRNHSGHEGHCLPTKEELAAEIHSLELRAYRCTIEALHASGPLSWEQEVLITNLRLSLNISNDEHLMQLKYLISASTSIPIR
ncbi:hypothetical protein SDJN03_15294, partial [Cucurbita argyrosperma subsp. sororia]